MATHIVQNIVLAVVVSACSWGSSAQAQITKSVDTSAFEFSDDALQPFQQACSEILGKRNVPTFRVEGFVDGRFPACNGACVDDLIDGKFEFIEVFVWYGPVTQPWQRLTPPEPGKYRFTKKEAADPTCSAYAEIRKRAAAEYGTPSNKKYEQYCVGMEKVKNYRSKLGVRVVMANDVKSEGLFLKGEEIFDVATGESLAHDYSLQAKKKVEFGELSVSCRYDSVSNKSLRYNLLPIE
jgi:hypothetical protein